VDDESNSDYSRSYGNEDSSDSDGDSDVKSEGSDEDDHAGSQREQDKIWLDSFIQDKLKKSISKVEQEVDNIRNKKVRGAVKKQKDMLKQLNDKLKLMRSTRIKCEELAMTMEFLDGGAIKPLKGHLKKYYEDHEQEQLRNNVDKEVENLINIADQNRKQEDVLGGVINQDLEEEKKQQEANDMSDSKYGHLSWLNKLIDLGTNDNQDVCLDKKVTELGQLKEGMIVDAQDYLDKWHLSIICKIQPKND